MTNLQDTSSSHRSGLRDVLSFCINSVRQLQITQRVAAIGSFLTVVVGIIAALHQLQATLTHADKALDEAQMALQTLKLESLPHINKLLEDNYDIQRREVEFLRAGADVSLLAYARDQLIAGQSGQAIYGSATLNEFRSINRYYEQTGALVTEKYLDFKIFFDVIPFPDAYWKRTEPLRQLISRNWVSANPREGLPDFLENFKNLCQLYRAERLKYRLTKLSCGS